MSIDPITISGLLHASEAPRHAMALSQLDRNDKPGRSLDRAGFLAEVERLAGIIHGGGFCGRKVLIPEKNSIEYVVGFFACVRAGAVAVTAHPPRPGGGGERLGSIIRDASPDLVLATSGVFQAFDRQAAGLLEGIDRLEYDAPESPEPFALSSVPMPGPEALALLQYTSGSTRNPTAVMITQANLFANGTVMRDLFSCDLPGGTVCWMPLYHDMGLIGLVLCTVLMDRPVHLMDPETFVVRPQRWLHAISETQSVHSGGPSFAYDLCAERITPDQREGLDLSSWKYAFNGAEPIRAVSIKRFQEAFGPVGFEASMPCYGLAESTLLVSVRRRSDSVRTFQLDGLALEDGRVAIGDSTAGTSIREVVSCGAPIPGHDVVIRDPETGTRVEPGGVGEITVRGPSVAVGYHKEPGVTKGTFPQTLAGEAGPWLRTGDLGAFLDGELVVVGRLKDLLIVDGRNIHPTDIEAVAEESHEAIAPHRSAAFAVAGEDGERIALVVEISRDAFRPVRAGDTDVVAFTAEIRSVIQGSISESHGVSIAQFLLVSPGAVPRTSSGKIRRSACKEAMQNGLLQSIDAQKS